MSRHVTPNGRGMGWRPSLPNHNRLIFASPMLPADMPAHVDLRDTGFVPEVYDQGQLGSCTGNALAFLMQYERAKQRLANASRTPSRLMIYWCERYIEGTVDSDSGAQGYDGIKALRWWGACFEDGPDGWPYDIAKFAQEPPKACWDAAKLDRAVISYQVQQDINSIRGCLASGYPVAFGFAVYPELDSSQVAHDGNLPMPGIGEDPIGGHEIAAIGYDDASRRLLIRNSWGAGWGDRGYFHMPYEYALRPDLAQDFETIRLITQ